MKSIKIVFTVRADIHHISVDPSYHVRQCRALTAKPRYTPHFFYQSICKYSSTYLFYRNNDQLSRQIKKYAPAMRPPRGGGQYAFRLCTVFHFYAAQRVPFLYRSNTCY